MKETICLIVPPSIFLLDERVFPSLGILKVASVLETNGYVVEFLDLCGVSNFEEAIGHHVAKSPATYFCLTATTPQMPSTYKIVKKIRQVDTSKKVIIGGPHPTLVSAAYKREIKLNTPGRATKALQQLTNNFDVVVAGDGEYSILEALKGNTNFVDADIIASSLFLTNKTYEESPPPARHLIDLNSYHYTIEGVPATSVIAQLGCPFSCGFCGGRESAMLRKIRTRSSKSILKELEFLHKNYGYNGFMFYDDELNVNKFMVPLMNDIGALAKSLNTEFKLRGFVKSELFTDEQAKAMYSAGFRWILTGFESGSPRILENINKKASREDNDRCFEIARRNGLKIKALMSMGHPGESEQTIKDTEEWLLKVKPDDFDMTIITTYPGTPYYDHAIETSKGIWTYTYPKTGDRLHAQELDYNEVADYYKGDPDGGYKAYVYTDFISSERLVEMRDALEKRVRTELGIPFNQSKAATKFEHSMGQSMLRVSDGKNIINK